MLALLVHLSIGARVVKSMSFSEALQKEGDLKKHTLRR